jgi:hypothetical protein
VPEAERAVLPPVVSTKKIKLLISRIAARKGCSPAEVVREALRRGLRDIVREMNAEVQGGDGDTKNRGGA